MSTIAPLPTATKILAIGRFTQPPTPELRRQFLPAEVPATLRLYLSGHIEQFWGRPDQTGPVFLMNVRTVEEARAVLEKLPLGEAKLMEFDFIAVGPLLPFALLAGN